MIFPNLISYLIRKHGVITKVDCSLFEELPTVDLSTNTKNICLNARLFRLN